MAKLHVRRTPLKWGNGFGVRLTQADFKKMGTTPEKPLDLELAPAAQGVDVAKLHMIRGRRTASADHTELSAES